jgi:ADP-ribose pyrophosphatase YjhB (NUDIX family)
MPAPSFDTSPPALVVVPPSLLDTPAVEGSIARAHAYADSLPPKKPMGRQALSGMPTVRRASRALVIDASDRLLLFRGHTADGSPGWYAPGGALDRDETYESALIRELREETGLVVQPASLAAPVWIRECLFSWRSTLERHLERFYLVRISEHDAGTAAIEAGSSGTPRDHRWWTIDEIRPSPERFAPARLAEHLGPLLNGIIPEEPVVVEE